MKIAPKVLLLLTLLSNSCIFSQKIDTLYLGKKYKLYYYQNQAYPATKADTIIVPGISYTYVFNEYGDSVDCYCNEKQIVYNRKNILSLMKELIFDDVYLNTPQNKPLSLTYYYRLNYVYREISFSDDLKKGDFLIDKRWWKYLKKEGGYIKFFIYFKNRHVMFSFYQKPSDKKIKKLKKKYNKLIKKYPCPKECAEFYN